MKEEKKPDDTVEPQPVDTPVEQNPAHLVDEDPEEHMGEQTLDPWDDPDQTDWATTKDAEEEVSN